MVVPRRIQESDKLTDGPLPLYYQIANLIRNEILGGNWPYDSLLPTEEKLVEPNSQDTGPGSTLTCSARFLLRVRPWVQWPD